MRLRLAPFVARRAPLALLLGWALLVLAPPAAWAKEVPYLAGHVNDTANLLSAEARQRIESQLTQYESETGHQIAVLTVDSLEGDPIEDFSLRVAETWKLGTQEKDDGVLLLVSRGDRKMRIEVGYGLEANLTDLQTSIIQNEVIIPEFKAGDFGGGIEKGVTAIVDTLKGKEPQAARPAPKKSRGGLPIPFLLFLFFFVLPFSWEAVQRRSWLLYLFFMPFYWFIGSLVHPAVGIGAVALWAIAFPVLRALVPKSSGLRGRRGGGGWWFPGGGGGWGSGGGWSGGGGGGGFSGGGGSFGGGGSSSSW